MDTYFPVRIRITEGDDKGKELVVKHHELPIGTAFVVLQINVMPNMSEQDLLPCPFCGAPAKYEMKRTGFGVYWDIGCQTEDCYLVSGADWWDDKEKVTKKWNTRAG